MSSSNTTRMVIDCDTGIDDALAILYALRTPEVVVEGITTVFGNIDVKQAADNTLRYAYTRRSRIRHPGSAWSVQGTGARTDRLLNPCAWGEWDWRR